MSKFNVGDKIIRVGEGFDEFGMFTGQVYTVDEIEQDYAESLSVKEIPNKYWLEEYFELANQPEQDCPYCIIDELEAKINSYEELISEQASQIRELQSDSQAQQAEYYRRLNDLLTSHRSFQESTECRSNELADTIKLLQLCYDSRYSN